MSRAGRGASSATASFPRREHAPKGCSGARDDGHACAPSRRPGLSEATVNGERLREGRPAGARLASRSAASRRGSSSWSMGRLGPCSAAPPSGAMMTRSGGRSNRSVAPADSVGVVCGAAAPRGPTRGSRGSRRIRRERCSEGASCYDGDGCSRASVRAPQRRSRRARACRGRLGAPPARAGARGRAWARRISR